MTPIEIRDFLESIKDTDIEEMTYKSGESSFYFKKSEVAPSLTRTDIQKIQQKEKPVSSPIIPIKSLMVGTFITAPGNASSPFVREGDKIIAGRKVGQIEAMKIIKDVFSDVEGKIIKIMVSNGEFVEYGQELFLVDTSKQENLA
ncbi:MAG: hypothetical protein LBU55_01905 [Elusimicrobiota bacterium]|jgi:acetyl-CoA carboxylase biotin carboxyl carrier protein|nr:hypothetical protein [Elusimicrobiota bacterium]